MENYHKNIIVIAIFTALFFALVAVVTLYYLITDTTETVTAAILYTLVSLYSFIVTKRELKEIEHQY